MSCVLRVYGADFDVDAFLRKSHLRPCEVWHKGDPRFGVEVGRKRRRHSGMNVDVSDADWDHLDLQLKAAVKFLKRHRPDLSRLRSNSSVQFAFLDFGIRLKDEELMQGAYLPPDLIQLAASVGIGIKVTAYAIENHVAAAD